MGEARTKSNFSLAIGFSTSSIRGPSLRREPFTPITDAETRSRRFFGSCDSSARRFVLLVVRDRAPRTAVPFAVTAVIELERDRFIS